MSDSQDIATQNAERMFASGTRTHIYGWVANGGTCWQTYDYETWDRLREIEIVKRETIK